MWRRTSYRPRWQFVVAACTLLVAFASRSAVAQSGSWGVTTSGSWSDSANWSGGTIASGSGSTASFTNDITSDVVVTLDSARELTAVTFGDAATATAGGWTIANGGNAANVLTLNGASTITVNALGTGKIARIDADITGTNGKVTKSGAGTLTIGGGFSIGTNEVNWNGGTVNLEGASLLSGKHITNGSGTTNWSVSSGTINGSGVLFGVGDNTPGTFNLLSGRLNYTAGSGFFIGNGGSGRGLMTVQGGTASLTGNASLWIGAGFAGTGNSATESGTLTITSGAFEYAGSGSIKLSGSNAGSRGTVNLDGGVFRLNGRQITSGSGVATFSINGGTLQLTAANTSMFATTVSPTIGASGVTIDTNGFAASFGASTPIRGAGTLTKINSGTLSLQPASPDFTGKTVISGGAIDTNADGKLGAAPGSFVADQLMLSSGGALRWTASGTLSANRGITVGSGGGTLSLGGVLTYGGRFTGAGNMLTVGGSDLVLSNTTGVATNVNWTVTGNRLFYNGLNTLGTGTVTIQSGATLVSQGTSPGTVSNAVIVQSGGRISARTSGTYTNVTLPTSGTVVFNRDDSITTTLAITSGVTLTGDLTVDMSQQAASAVGNATLSGIVAGTGHRLIKTGGGTAPGKLILSGANTYSGGTTITGGAVSVSSDGNLGAVPGSFDADNIILNGGTLEAGTSFTVNANRGITVEAAGGSFAGGIIYPGRISGAGNTLSITGNGDKVLSNSTGSPSDVNFNVTGGRLFFTNTDAIGSGSVAVGNTANLVANMAGTPSIANAVTLASGGRLSARQSGATFTNVTLPTSGTVWFNDDDQPTGTLTVTSAATLGGALQLTTTQQATGAIGPAILSGPIGGTGTVTKTGGGQFTLSGSNSYVGNTTISAGTLVAGSPTALGSGTVTVASGATLRLLPGAIVANAIANSGTLAFAGGGIQRTSDESLASVMTFVAGSEASPLTTIAPTIAWLAKEADTYSDVLDLGGTAGAYQILTLAYDEALIGSFEDSAYLGWKDGTTWVNAIDGNSTTGGSAIPDYTGSYTAAGVLPTAAYLGSWGRDVTTNTVWAVVDHNSEFAVLAVPEPAALALAFGGLASAACAARCRGKRRR